MIFLFGKRHLIAGIVAIRNHRPLLKGPLIAAFAETHNFDSMRTNVDSDKILPPTEKI